MNTRILRRLVTTSLSVVCFYVPTFYTNAAAPNCDNILATNRTSVSDKMVSLLGKDITISNHITTVIPTQNNPFVTEELVSVSNDVSPNGSLPKQTPEEIKAVRANLEQATQEAERLQSTLELAFVGVLDGYCQFSTHELTEAAKIDFDHVEGLVLYSIPALIAMVDQSYAMAVKPDEENNENETTAIASYQSDNVLVKVEEFDGSHLTFSVTNVAAEGAVEPEFNTFKAYRTDSGSLTYRTESLLSIQDASGNSLPTIGIAELSSQEEESLTISPGETRKFITQLESEVDPHSQLSIEFPARALNTAESFSLSFADSSALATAGVN